MKTRSKVVLVVLYLLGYADAAVFYFRLISHNYICPVCVNVDTLSGSPAVNLLRQASSTLLFGSLNALMLLSCVLLIRLWQLLWRRRRGQSIA